ncbi:MAG: ketoacyl-ACP synthase III [Caldilinea sp.]|nr:ketoacyl-ACP synthase III [Caldilineaceae bacterium]MCO5209606.1 ketoacyl-ACP synthase III [Caldilinea sp.]MCB9115109.1 ketoacyl-ACP synthase III [Caldilineaceae bacterium]MCB9119167.1 ketoacyl-ACP synthase III [Caldilineaceae bacterium]MCW5844482.1 ketoacyl-ACP synthase III [Caldilinea sp.]
MAKTYGKITGWGAYAPPRIITNHELEATLDTSHDWIVQRTGIHARHVADANETTSTMAVKASWSALAKAGIPSTELDLILVATSSPDYFTPPVSSMVQSMLGAHDVPAMTIVTGCTGFVYALVTAYQFIETGAYRNILVVGVELLSRFVNWEERSVSVLFGDAAGAVVVQPSDEPCGLEGYVLGSDGTNGQAIIMPAGGSARPFSEDVLQEGSHYLQMNGREVFKFATRVIGPSCDEALRLAGKSMADVDWIIPHQANLRIIQAAAKDMDIPLDRWIVNIDQYANTSAASIPLALAESLESGRVKPTDTLLLVSFGAGMTWASAVLQMQPN